MRAYVLTQCDMCLCISVTTPFATKTNTVVHEHIWGLGLARDRFVLGVVETPSALSLELGLRPRTCTHLSQTVCRLGVI